MKRKGYDEGNFFDLVKDGAVRECKTARTDTPKGLQWAFYFRLGGPGSEWKTIRSQREPVRTWASLDTVASFADAAGIRLFAVEQ